ncbi:response regulator transcription factor [Streptomyces tricolor]|nr:response regulator transcription factor [Streptomyces tricolor]
MLLRAGLVELLTSGGHEVVAAVGDAEALVSAVDEHRPDVVVTDVRMPPGHHDEGLRAVMVLRRRYADLPVLVLSQYVATVYATQLLSGGGAGTGGLGYLLKDRVGEVSEFLDALARVAAGHTVIDPEVVRVLLVQQAQAETLGRLTSRGAGGARADGAGPEQPGHRAASDHHRVVRGQARQQHLHEAGPRSDRRQPARPGRSRPSAGQRPRVAGTGRDGTRGVPSTRAAP